MSKKANKTVIGAFVIGAIALAVAGVAILGGGKFLKKSVPYVLYFEGSVKGLNIGAPVSFQGARIGSVTDIVIRMEGEGDRTIPRIVVYMEIVQGRVEVPEGSGYRSSRTEAENRERMEFLVEKGLRAQLEMQSMVTGQLMVMLDFHPEEPARFHGHDNTKIMELPTIPTPFEMLLEQIDNVKINEIFENVDKILSEIEEMLSSPETDKAIKEMNEAIAELNKLLKTLNEKAGPILDNTDEAIAAGKQLVSNLDAEIKPLANALDGTLEDTRKLVNNLDEQVAPLAQDTGELIRNVNERFGPLAEELERTLGAAADTMEEAGALAARLRELAADDSTVMYETTRMLESLSATAQSFRNLADYLERHPEALLKGKP
jgi:paraquat-inducible protein B